MGEDLMVRGLLRGGYGGVLAGITKISNSPKAR